MSRIESAARSRNRTLLNYIPCTCSHSVFAALLLSLISFVKCHLQFAVFSCRHEQRYNMFFASVLKYRRLLGMVQLHVRSRRCVVVRRRRPESRCCRCQPSGRPVGTNRRCCATWLHFRTTSATETTKSLAGLCTQFVQKKNCI